MSEEEPFDLWDFILNEISPGQFEPWDFTSNTRIVRPEWSETWLRYICQDGDFWGWRMRGSGDSRYPRFYVKNPGGRPVTSHHKYEVWTTEAGISLVRAYIAKLRGEGLDI